MRRSTASKERNIHPRYGPGAANVPTVCICLQIWDTILGGKDEKEAPASGWELTAQEQQNLLKYCYLFSKISLSRVVLYSVPYLKQPAEVMKSPLVMAQIAMEDPDRMALQLFLLDESGDGEDFLEQLRTKLEEEHKLNATKETTILQVKILIIWAVSNEGGKKNVYLL